MKTIKFALDIGEKTLATFSIESPLNEARIILAFALSVNKSYLIGFSENIITLETFNKYLELLEMRKLGIPLAYIVGKKEFWGLSLKVSSATLIPRPDTESLINTLFDLGFIKKNKTESINILDLGTGTGAIALALKSELPCANVFACDQNMGAVDLAIENAKSLNLKIDIRQSNWFDAFPIAQFNNFFDLIITNPPYIDKNDIHLKNDGVKYEPLSALISEASGLYDIQEIIKLAPSFLKDMGMLMIEHGYDQSDKVFSILTQFEYINIGKIKDLSSNDRGAFACYKKKLF